MQNNTIPEYEDEDDDYQGIDIHSEVFHQDLDDINFEGEIDDDSDEEAAKQFGY